MILSGRDLQWYIQCGKLKINGAAMEQFQQNGVDLVLEDIDKEMTEDGKKWMFDSTFYLGTTKEWVELPDDLMAFVQLRSTWARKGILLPPTIIDAGFKGNITIEIVNFRHQPAPLGEPFIHLIFAKTTSPCVPYAGKYQNQTGITGAR